MDKGTILITGASRGIGFHLAHRFLQEGYGVVGVSRTPAPIDNPDYHEFTVDLGDLDQVQALSSELAGLPIAGVINNAGIHGPVGAFENLPLVAWFKTFNVNLFGAAAMTQTCIPSLRRHNGFIIFLSGGGSAFPRPNYSAYGVSKCAVIRLADVLAKELSPQVLVYCIAPGPGPFCWTRPGKTAKWCWKKTLSASTTRRTYACFWRKTGTPGIPVSSFT